MFDFILFSLCIFSLSCSHSKNDSQPTTNQLQELQDKYNTYSELAGDYATNLGGFISTGCDSLLFTGLYSSASGSGVALEKARDADGKWHRRSLDLPECYPDESASEISRDMYLGLLWGIWRHGRKDLLDGVVSYGEDKNWNMGEGDASRTILSPALISTIYIMVERLGGGDQGSKKDFPILVDKGLKGFQAHLQILHLLLRAEMGGNASDAYIDEFARQAERQPQNALFQASYHRFSDGDQSEAIKILMDESHWPNNSLPTTDNHCEFWLWQRDDGEDWLPCEPLLQQSGGDWLFAAKLILN